MDVYSLMEMANTLEQHERVIGACKELFESKNKDYGSSWRVMRLPSCTDQMFIKVKRIRTIQEKGKQRVDDGVDVELMGIINYGVIALIQLRLVDHAGLSMRYEELSRLYDECVKEIRVLLLQKNHDYGEIWRDMRVGSLVDIMFMKLLRIKCIEDNGGQTLVSEGVKTNYQDIVNYAVFSLIHRGFVSSG